MFSEWNEYMLWLRYELSYLTNLFKLKSLQKILEIWNFYNEFLQIKIYKYWNDLKISKIYNNILLKHQRVFLVAKDLAG